MKKNKQKEQGAWVKQLKKLPWLLLIPFGLYLPRLAASYPEWIEQHYTNGVYPHISGTIAKLSALTDFSVVELIIYALVFSLALSLVVRLLMLFFRKTRAVSLVSFLLSVAVAGGVLLCLFFVLWGFNYSRPALSGVMRLDVHERPVSELEELCERLAKNAEALRAEVNEDENGVFTLVGGYQASFQKIPAAYKALNEKHHLFLHDAVVPKAVLYSEGLSYAGIAGIYIPFTAEANVNVSQPPLLLPVSAAHEAAHFLGVGREDEANFMAYLACVASDDPTLAYSGTMLALITAGNKLHASDAEKYRALYASYSNGMKRDITYYNSYWDAYKGPIEETVNKVNDNYLKFNNQENGVKSYGMMVDLLLAYFAKG